MEKKIKVIKTTEATIKEHGPNLPLGILNSEGKYVKDIAVRPWRMKEEKELGLLKESNRSANIAQYVSMVLSTMCTQIGPHNFDSLKKDSEKRIYVSQMFIGDVFYTYMWLRIQSIGSNLEMNISCPNCNNKFPFSADLNTTTVITCDNLDDAKWEYKLRTPFEIRGKRVDGFLMGPPRWNCLESASSGPLNASAAKATIILSSIYGVSNWKDNKGNIQSIAITPNELDEMTKIDIEGITSELDNVAIGPNMALEGECPRCRQEFTRSIDWNVDNFFSISSR